jgi:hypothetical protein
MAQTPRAPNVEAQRTAMKKLEFLVGDWSGEATVLRGLWWTLLSRPNYAFNLLMSGESCFCLGQP